jgi:hypothetical protein
MRSSSKMIDPPMQSVILAMDAMDAVTPVRNLPFRNQRPEKRKRGKRTKEKGREKIDRCRNKALHSLDRFGTVMARVKCIIIAFSIQVITTLRVGSIAALRLIVCVRLVKGMGIQNLKVSVVSLRQHTSPEI